VFHTQRGGNLRPLGRRDRQISAGTYLRLQLPDLLPPEVERVLYLDCDVLCAGDLSPLWEVPLGEAPVAAVRDAFTRTIDDRGGVPGAGPDFDAKAAYFNSGVLLIHAPVWRERSVTEQCLKYLWQQRGQLRLADQDALNLATYGQWIRLERKWNNMMRWLNEPTLQEQLIDDVRMIHFAGPKKAWKPDFPPGVLRDRYLDLTSRVSAFAAPPVGDATPQ
jgi:UDP-D-galactose:(glucosyl)LPS alpha-1,3-D-galactosyltransferase